MTFDQDDLTLLRSLISEEQGRAAKWLATTSGEEREFYSRMLDRLTGLGKRLAARGAAARLERAMAAEEAELEEQEPSEEA
jgi:hypothetical protein